MKPKSVLVVVTRRIGDVLLATPLIRSLKRAWPQARIDALVFKGTEGVLSANPDVHRVLTVPQRAGLGEHARLYARLFRRYDVALSLLTGDRPTLYAAAFGRWKAGLQTPTAKESWKRRLLDRWVPFDNLDTHTVRMHLALAETLAVPQTAEVVVSWGERDAARVTEALGSDAPFAVLHPFPKFNYKKWHAAGWRELGAWIAERGLRIVLTGGPDAAEREYVAAVARELPAPLNLAGGLSLPMLGALLSRASLYVGPDTAATHMAAAVGIPTVALFGPSNPVKWGPWPRGHPAERNPWARVGSGRVGNVFLVQGEKSCVPCLLEGCGRHVESYSDCLQELPASRVIDAARALLEDRG
ncbi:MAG TPA: glycosyltransferase family 9 protein [Pelomicrobium sp.]|nr:glycosyltransferase family 9 protein [Pelomicrobium sp.]